MPESNVPANVSEEPGYQTDGITAGKRDAQTKAEAEAAENRRREEKSEVEKQEDEMRDGMVEGMGYDDLNVGARPEGEA